MNPVLLLLYAEAFWQEFHVPMEIVMLLVGSAIFMKWAVDDFRYSRVSAITWLLAVSSLLGPIWAAMYVTSPAVQARIDQMRQHRELIQPVLRGHSPPAAALLPSSRVGRLVSHKSVEAIAWAGTAEDSNGDAPIESDDTSESAAQSSLHDVAGTWISRDAGMDLTIKQQGGALKGFWVFILGHGGFTGQIQGRTLNFRLRHRGRGCNIALQMTLVSDTEMDGTYLIGTCKPASAGGGIGGAVNFIKEIF